MNKIIFWVTFFLLIYTYVGYIALCLLWSKIFGKKLKKEEYYPYLSIIVACYNEERVIREKLENLLSLDYPRDKLQIIIASESKDNTNEIVSKYKNRGIQLYTYDQRCGKSMLLYRSVPYANGEILVFSDANAIYNKDALKKIARNFINQNVGAVTGALLINNPRDSAISRGEYLYKKYEAVLRKANSLSKRVLNSDGSIFAIRKNLYRPLAADRGDDFELVIRVLNQGYDSVFEPEAISYEEASVTSRLEATRKIRMVSWFLKSTIILLKEMALKGRLDLILQLVSHKLLRWLTPYFLIILCLSNIYLYSQGGWYKFFLWGQISVYLMGLLGMYVCERQKKNPPLLLGVMQYFLIFNYAFFIGVIRGIFPTKSSAAWEKVRR